MSLAIVQSRAIAGIDAPLVTIEVHLARGIPGLGIVGLLEKEVKESKDRVRSAIMNSGFDFPIKRITVNLAPADLPKEGGRFDLPIALGILVAAGYLPQQVLHDYEFAGELALSGHLRPILGVLPFALATAREHKKLILPEGNGREASIANHLELYTADHILAVCAHLQGRQRLSKQSASLLKQNVSYPDLADVKGQAHARRALEIAAAGGHSLLFTGPPGAGKTMLSSRLPSILPEISESDALEVASVQSMSSQRFSPDHWRLRPFRAPHHSASSVAMVGGGNPPRPGEISLAHHGVLFLDELPEFQRPVLEALREPLESGWVTISRAAKQAKFPARFQLVAAMNPCPCGYHGDPSSRCHCTIEKVQRYAARISGPLLDRIDMHVKVHALAPTVLMRSDRDLLENSGEVRQRVVLARDFAAERAGKPNVLLSSDEIRRDCELSSACCSFLEAAITRLNLSGRAYHRILKVARTIADLAQSQAIAQNHLQEALSYRKLNFNA